MEFFEGPILLHKSHGEVVKEGWVVRELTLHSEIIDGWDNSFAKEGSPLTVDHDAGGKGVVGRNEPAGERQTILGEFFFFRENSVGESWGDDIFGLGVLAPMAEVGRANVVARTLFHDEGLISFRGLSKRLDLISLFFDLGSPE